MKFRCAGMNYMPTSSTACSEDSTVDRRALECHAFQKRSRDGNIVR